MSKLAIYSACIGLSLASSITIASSGDELDEVTIGIFNDDHINNDIHEIEPPDFGEPDHDPDREAIQEDHELDHEADRDDHEASETSEDSHHEEDDQGHGEPELEHEPEVPDGPVVQ